MNKILMAALLALQIVTAKAQTNDDLTAINRLQRKMNEASEDTLKVLLFDSLGIYYSKLYPDSLIGATETQTGLGLATKDDYKKGKAACLAQLGDINFGSFLNYTAALDYYTQAKNLYDSFPSTNSEKSKNLHDIAFIYFNEGYYSTALDYFKKQYAIAQKIDSFQIIRCLLNLGACYMRLSDTDTGHHYYDSGYNFTYRAYELSKTKQDSLHTLFMIESSANLASNFAARGEDDSAYAAYTRYFNAVYMKYFIAKPSFYCQVTLYLADYFARNQQNDSAAYYAKNALEVAQQAKNYPAILKAENFLADFYYRTGDVKSAYGYLQDELTDKEIVADKKNTEKIMNIDFQEQKHKDYIEQLAEENKRKQSEAITHSGIGLFIIGFFILLLIMGRKKVESRTIDFLCTLFLLMMFEFITLVIHPKIAVWTNDNQVAMFLILVGIAGFILEPLHHKMEDWIRTKIEHKAHGL